VTTQTGQVAESEKSVPPDKIDDLRDQAVEKSHLQFLEGKDEGPVELLAGLLERIRVHRQNA
jgi:hypothetical protein